MEVITRSEAKERGLSRFFSGKPCNRGHVADRFVANGHCSVCNAIRAAEYKAQNKDRIKAYNQTYQAKNREALSERWVGYYQSNRDELLKRRRAYSLKKPWVDSANNAKRRARVARAVPSWFGDIDELVWQEAVDLVRLRYAATGFRWAADHMIPLKCKTASGLHVSQNCQVIPAVMNLMKKNRMDLTVPGAWIMRTHQKF